MEIKRIVFILVLAITPRLSPCQSTGYFENPIVFDENNGISMDYITDVIEDNNGFLWIAGPDGLLRFDGNHFKKYSHIEGDSLSIGNNDILDLNFDEENNKLWISCWAYENGLSILDLETEKFTNYPFRATNPKGMMGMGVRWTFKDVYGNFWIGVRNTGMAHYLPQLDSFVSVTYKPLSTESDLNITSVNAMTAPSPDKYNDSILWIGSGAGLLKFNVITHAFERYPIVSYTDGTFAIRSVLHHQNNLVYIGTWAEGLFSFDPVSKKIYKCDLGEPIKNYSNIACITPISKHTIWVTMGLGLVEYQVPQNKTTNFWEHDISKNRNYYVRQVDRRGRILSWYGSRLVIYEPKRQQVKTYRHESVDKKYSMIVRRILNDHESNKLWIVAQMSEGLYRLDLKTETWEIYPPPASYFNHQATFSGWDALQTQSGELLVLDANTIYHFSKEEKKLKPWKLQPDAKGAKFRTIIEDVNGNIWVGTYLGGLFKINPFNNTIRKFSKEFRRPGRSDPGAIWDLQEDRNGNIWIRTEGYAVYQSDRDTLYNFPYFFPEKEIVYHIASLGIDGEGNVWIGSYEGSIGITNADQPEKGIIQYFDRRHGLKSTKQEEFLLDHDDNVWIMTNGLEKISPGRDSSRFFKSAYVTPKGLWSIDQLTDLNIALGFKKGIAVFNPDSLWANQELARPYVYSFKVFDEELLTDLPLYNTKDIYLQSNHNFFSLEISAFDPSYLGDLGFLYKLEGVDPEWVNPGRRRYIAYTDVGSGSFTFSLKASNSEGIWNDTPYTLRIHIAAPWYRTWWAYLLASLFLIAIIYLTYRMLLTRKMSKQETLRLKELNTFKTRFYSNITHEFRTPITVILGIVDVLKGETNLQGNRNTANFLEMINRNGKKLLKLINELLDFAKLESGSMELQLIQDDIIPFIKYLSESFHSLAQERNINLTVYSEIDTLEMDFDPTKITSIISNLLSNAIKFTPANKKIMIHLNKINESGKEFLILKVKDDGIGIAPADKTRLFDRFYQIDSSMSRSHDGTGIGLSIVKDFVELMNGTMHVESTLGKGSTFLVRIPITNDAAKITTINPPMEIGMTESNHTPGELTITADNKDLSLVLIIEDNLDVAYYLKICLHERYKTVHAINGQLGVDMARELTPDIIICDVMMPIKDGFEVCQELKSDEQTDHIPIVLLTAKATAQDRLTGLSHGADAYLSKPFVKAELFTRLDQLIAMRKKLIDRFNQSSYTNIVSKLAQDREVKFVHKAVKAIHENISDQDYGVEQLSRSLYLSRSQTYRKLKAITGKSVAVFIRSVRLQHAKELLLATKQNISEIAFDCGFNDPNWFGRAFRQEFGMAPSDLRS